MVGGFSLESWRGEEGFRFRFFWGEAAFFFLVAVLLC